MTLSERIRLVASNIIEWKPEIKTGGSVVLAQKMNANSAALFAFADALEGKVLVTPHISEDGPWKVATLPYVAAAGMTDDDAIRALVAKLEECDTE